MSDNNNLMDDVKNDMIQGMRQLKPALLALLAFVLLLPIITQMNGGGASHPDAGLATKLVSHPLMRIVFLLIGAALIFRIPGWPDNSWYVAIGVTFIVAIVNTVVLVAVLGYLGAALGAFLLAGLLVNLTPSIERKFRWLNALSKEDM